ncbi:MAG: signal peptidase II [Gammaproteobacteria bacterium]|nr:signal peptidase II [Gammaproteobacteria bacterium]MCD8573847.1 signal peptidase II [Gammaproteobacteria bacterium]
MNRLLTWLWLSIFVAVVDQITKKIALSHLMNDSLAFFPLLNFSLAFNRGAAFSFLNQAAGWQNSFFIGVSIICIIALIVWMCRQQYARQKTALALIIGGALGNLIDRIHHGFVVDFIDAHIGQYHWPTFNIADAAICFGVALLFLFTFNRVK